MSDIPQTARVVIIGGGIVGTSILWHLTQKGWTDCVLLEKNELTAGSTWHAAGNCPTFSTDFAIMSIQKYSTDLYRALGEKVDYPLNYNVSGAVRLGHDDRRTQEFAKVRSMGQRLGMMDVEMLTPDEMQARYPFAETHDLDRVLFDPWDGDIDPSQVTQAFAKGARDAGAKILRFCPATGVRREGGKWVVAHKKGEITCDIVVNAAGYYAGRVGAWFEPFGGRPVPMAVMAHQYMLTDEIPEIAAWTRANGGKLPILRDVDTSYYLRQEKTGYNLGPYERDCRAHWTGGDAGEVPEDFSFQLFPDDLDRLEVYMEDAMARVPKLGESGISKVINGPIPYAPDGLPLIGPMPGVPNAFEATAFTFGIVQGGGAGKVLADWIVDGRPEWDCWSVDPRRFTDYTDPQYCIDKAQETYGHEFAMHFPQHTWPAGRDRKLSPVDDRVRAAGGQMGVYGGWERANWYAKDGDDTSQEATLTWSRSGPWEARIAEEVAAVRDGCGVLDLCGFSRFAVEGPGAERWLDGLLSCALPKGRAVGLAYLLDEDGRLRTEFSIRRTEGGFELITAAAAEWHDRDLLLAAVPVDGSVTVTNRTGEVSTLLVTGARARDVLAPLTDGDLSLPWLTHQTAQVAGHEVCLLRVSFAGELGWELHAAPAAMPDLWDAVTGAGAVPFGMYALNSMRLEKGYAGWKSEISHDYTPAQLRLNRFIAKDKPAAYPGKAAVATATAARKIVSLIVEGSDKDAPVAAPVRMGGRIVGEVTSAAYGHRVGAAIALAMVDAGSAAPGTVLTVDVYGTDCTAEVQPRICLWDPKNERLRA
ncbi:FAD-dependent oxidoreductase [Jannaschia sp. M317]|uniref:GcvT family protein n=1 Tax=Jannaschia sp. M317 TaxID=2867011 RepID=UPI0021A3881C|nr:FAD-dependent oxidoreductase [Jannaschia sp. M317]UWQ17747.1 FAD-dependent oxidoreductase [Jannaschia sp. M317]